MPRIYLSLVAAEDWVTQVGIAHGTHRIYIADKREDCKRVIDKHDIYVILWGCREIVRM
jgi:methyl coenzyme M reductase subunit C-like uncharacterized protein (methanogenesis marker protein 7)